MQAQPALIRGEAPEKETSPFVSCDLEQTVDVAVSIDIDAVSGRFFTQTRHGHDCAGECNDESSTGRKFYITEREYWVFAIQIGSLSLPSFSISAIALFASEE